MNNKQHEYILRAFVASSIPTMIRTNARELIALDSAIGGFCSQVLSGTIKTHIIGKILSEEVKQRISELINDASGQSKNEMIIYYRLMELAEMVLFEVTM